MASSKTLLASPPTASTTWSTCTGFIPFAAIAFSVREIEEGLAAEGDDEGENGSPRAIYVFFIITALVIIAAGLSVMTQRRRLLWMRNALLAQPLEAEADPGEKPVFLEGFVQKQNGNSQPLGERCEQGGSGLQERSGTGKGAADQPVGWQAMKPLSVVYVPSESESSPTVEQEGGRHSLSRQTDDVRFGSAQMTTRISVAVLIAMPSSSRIPAPYRSSSRTISALTAPGRLSGVEDGDSGSEPLPHLEIGVATIELVGQHQPET